MHVSAKKITRHFLVVLLASGGFSACKVAGDDAARTTTPQEGVVVLASYSGLVADPNASVMLNLPTDAQNGYTLEGYNSTFQAQALAVATNDSLEKIASPAPRCRLLSEPSDISLSVSRRLDIGDLKLSIGGESESLPKNEDFTIGRYLIRLAPGTYSLTNTAHPEAMALNHVLRVVEPSTSILVSSGAALNQPVSILGTIGPNDPAWIVSIAKASGAKIQAQAPAGTSYVSVMLSDGQLDAEGASNPQTTVICTAAPGAPITIPPELLQDFVGSADPAQSRASLTVDFVSVDRRTKQGKVTDALVDSRTRHIHGGAFINLRKSDGSTGTYRSPFGLVLIE